MCDIAFLSVRKCIRGNRLPGSARSAPLNPQPPFFARSGTILKTDRRANSAALQRETGRETNKRSVRQAGRPTGIHELRGSEVNSLTAGCSALWFHHALQQYSLLSSVLNLPYTCTRGTRFSTTPSHCLWVWQQLVCQRYGNFPLTYVRKTWLDQNNNKIFM